MSVDPHAQATFKQLLDQAAAEDDALMHGHRSTSRPLVEADSAKRARFPEKASQRLRARVREAGPVGAIC